MKKKIYLGLFIFLITLLMTGCNNTSQMLSLSDQQLLSQRVYNLTVAENENIDMVETIDNVKFSHQIFFSKIIVHQSFYITTNFDVALTPFFSDDILGKDIDTVVALIGLYDSKGKELALKFHMVIFKLDDTVLGFVSPQSTDKSQIDAIDEMTFGSYMFLTNKSIVKSYEAGDELYDFKLNKNEESFDFDVTKSIGFTKNDIESHDILVKENSYRQLGGNVAEEIINLSKVERKRATAEVLSINLENRIIEIRSNELTTLKTIYVSKGVLNNNNIDSLNTIVVGDIISFDYFTRYTGYAPTHLTLEYIYN